MLLREKMEYTLPDEPEEFKAPLQNRIAVDWVALHLISTVNRLTDQRASAYHFLKNGGMAFANKVPFYGLCIICLDHPTCRPFCRGSRSGR